MLFGCGDVRLSYHGSCILEKQKKDDHSAILFFICDCLSLFGRCLGWSLSGFSGSIG